MNASSAFARRIWPVSGALFGVVLTATLLAACDNPLAPAATATPIQTPTVGMDTRVAIAMNQTATVLTGGGTQTAKAAVGAAQTVTAIADAIVVPITQTAVANGTQAAVKAQTALAQDQDSTATAEANVPTATPNIPPTTRPAPATTKPASNIKVLRGPQNFDLKHTDPNAIEVDGFQGVDVRDFDAAARFYNPYSIDQGGWDYGILFRSTSTTEFRVYVDSSAAWRLSYLHGDTIDRIGGGQLTNLNTADGGHNVLEVLAVGSKGKFYCNDVPIADLDLSAITTSGDVIVGTAFRPPNRIIGKVTHVEDFTIYVPS